MSDLGLNKHIMHMSSHTNNHSMKQATILNGPTPLTVDKGDSRRNKETMPQQLIPAVEKNIQNCQDDLGLQLSDSIVHLNNILHKIHTQYKAHQNRTRYTHKEIHTHKEICTESEKDNTSHKYENTIHKETQIHDAYKHNNNASTHMINTHIIGSTKRGRHDVDERNNPRAEVNKKQNKGQKYYERLKKETKEILDHLKLQPYYNKRIIKAVRSIRNNINSDSGNSAQNIKKQVENIKKILLQFNDYKYTNYKKTNQKRFEKRKQIVATNLGPLIYIKLNFNHVKHQGNAKNIEIANLLNFIFKEFKRVSVMHKIKDLKFGSGIVKQCFTNRDQSDIAVKYYSIINLESTPFLINLHEEKTRLRVINRDIKSKKRQKISNNRERSKNRINREDNTNKGESGKTEKFSDPDIDKNLQRKIVRVESEETKTFPDHPAAVDIMSSFQNLHHITSDVSEETENFPDRQNRTQNIIQDNDRQLKTQTSGPNRIEKFLNHRSTPQVITEKQVDGIKGTLENIDTKSDCKSNQLLVVEDPTELKKKLLEIVSDNIAKYHRNMDESNKISIENERSTREDEGTNIVELVKEQIDLSILETKQIDAGVVEENIPSIILSNGLNIQIFSKFSGKIKAAIKEPLTEIMIDTQQPIGIRKVNIKMIKELNDLLYHCALELGDIELITLFQSSQDNTALFSERAHMIRHQPFNIEIGEISFILDKFRTNNYEIINHVLTSLKEASLQNFADVVNFISNPTKFQSNDNNTVVAEELTVKQEGSKATAGKKFKSAKRKILSKLNKLNKN